jgi:Zinc binding domain
VGRVVADETIQAILKPGHAEGLLAVERRFCRTPSCAVLYYGADERIVEKGAASVRVGVKETEDPVPLCYCFGFTRADVRREVAETGASTIPDRVDAEIRAGRCACERKNPSGACCLGEVRRAVKEATAANATARAHP